MKLIDKTSLPKAKTIAELNPGDVFRREASSLENVVKGNAFLFIRGSVGSSGAVQATRIKGGTVAEFPQTACVIPVEVELHILS